MTVSNNFFYKKQILLDIFKCELMWSKFYTFQSTTNTTTKYTEMSNLTVLALILNTNVPKTERQFENVNRNYCVQFKVQYQNLFVVNLVNTNSTFYESRLFHLSSYRKWIHLGSWCSDQQFLKVGLLHIISFLTILNKHWCFKLNICLTKC